MEVVMTPISGLRSLLSPVLALGVAMGGLQAGGVTVITHGFNGNVQDWVIPMADEMSVYPGIPGSESACYVLKVTSTSGPATAERRGEEKPNLSDSGEVFIKLDWSNIAGLLQASTQQVAAVAVAALMDPDLIAADTGGRPLAELPIHLIGHSRGASVVTEMARLLGEQGIWVDQVTTLDPVPLSLNRDAAVKNWENVLFADNYWENEDSSAFLWGHSLAGAFNRKLAGLGGGYGSSHSDTHLWYHGTAELGTPGFDTQETITAAMRDAWWVDGEDEGAGTGYLYSRVGGGDRNPWNGNEVEMRTGTLPKTGTGAVELENVVVSLAGVEAGSYFVAVRLADGMKRRVLYASEPVEVRLPRPRIDRTSVRVEDGLMKFSVLGVSGQRVIVEASEDLEQWEAVGVMELEGEGWEFCDAGAGNFERRFYRMVEGAEEL